MRSISKLLLVVLVLLPASAHATVWSYTVAGSVRGTRVPDGFTLLDEEPFLGGEGFDLTFDFDDSVPASEQHPVFSFYPAAVSNLSLTIFDGIDSFLRASPSIAVMAIASGLHQWSFFASAADTNLPGTLTVEDDVTFDQESLVFGVLRFRLIDSSESLLSQSPPELVAFDPEAPSKIFMELVWIGSGDPGDVWVRFDVDAVSVVPEPRPTALALGGLAGLVALGRRREGGSAL